MASENKGSAKLGFEQTLWAAAKLRDHMDAAEYKHVVLGLIFLKYLPDAFGEKYDELAAQQAQGADNVTIDWAVKEGVRTKLRVLIKRILRKYGYPPDKREKAAETVLQQAGLLSAEWAVV